LQVSPNGASRNVEDDVPSFATASAGQVEQNRALRARWTADELARNDRLRIEGLAAVERHYKPLHPETRSRELKPFLAPGLEGGVLTRRVAAEVSPGVYAADLLTPRFATMLWDEFHHYEAFAQAHPDLGIPLHFRHDGNMGSLQDFG
jgi:hypothetical protein